jgi:hypothetical protein
MAIAVDSTMEAVAPPLDVEKIKMSQTLEGGLEPFLLDALGETAARYDSIIVARRGSKIEKPLTEGSTQEKFARVLRAYNTLLSSFLATDLVVQAGTVDSCLLRLPTDESGRMMSAEEANSTFQKAFYPFPVLFKGREERNLVVDVSRLLAHYEYLKSRRTSQAFVNRVLNRGGERFWQILRLTWNGPAVDTYADNFVGYPRLLARKASVVVSEPVRVGHPLSVVPIARYCVGPSANTEDVLGPCLGATSRRPYGTFLGKSGQEKCLKCGGEMDPLSFLNRTRFRDKSMAEIIEPGLSEHILLGTFAIYLATFGSIVKVGRTFKSRVVTRLLEQGASEALVFYPIQTLKTADRLEKKLTTYLKGRLTHPTDMEVRANVSREIKLENARQITSGAVRTDPGIYRRIVDLIKDSGDPEVKSLALVERRVVNLTENWEISRPFDKYQLLEDFEFKAISGRVEGWVGSFLFVSDWIVDIRALSGYVVSEVESTPNPS